MSSQKNTLTIISGGNTGADMSALRAALKLGLPITGYAAKNFWSGGISNYDLKDIYGLKEMPNIGYRDKEIANVKLCDALLAIRIRKPDTGRGTESTINYLVNGQYEYIPLEQDVDIAYYNNDTNTRHVMVLWNLTDKNYNYNAKVTIDFLTKYNIKKLMISGPIDTNLEPIFTIFFEEVFSQYMKVLNNNLIL